MSEGGEIEEFSIFEGKKLQGVLDVGLFATQFSGTTVDEVGLNEHLRNSLCLVRYMYFENVSTF